jgi:branched-chain amino acid transport system ATP-binding protein
MNMNTNNSAALSLRNVSRNFGGIRAVSDISFDVRHGQRLTIIGTNGAGKSTLFNLIAGAYSLSSGSISIFGEDVSKQSARKRAGMGLARTFQTSKLFTGLTARQNLFVALHKTNGVKRGGLFSSPARDSQLVAESTEALRKVDLLHKADVKVSEFSHGETRQLEVAMALALNPRLLMLDEPAAGISPSERGRLVDLLRSLDKDISLLLIEHDMAIALAVADHVIVMHDGNMFMQGTPDDIRNSSEVRDLYLGHGHE